MQKWKNNLFSSEKPILLISKVHGILIFSFYLLLCFCECISFTFVLLFVQYTFYYSLWDFGIVNGLRFTTHMHQQEDFLFTMQVETEQRRAGVECFLASVRSYFP